MTWNEVPGAIALPAFYEAPVLSGGPVPEFPRCDYHFRVVAPARPMPDDARRIGVSLAADSRMFTRMLAKIGLGLAVARIGTQGYEPLVRGLILDGTDKRGVVGGYAGTDRAEPLDQALHTLRLETNDGLQGSLIIAEIRLFADFNGPTNYVAVGRWL